MLLTRRIVVASGLSLALPSLATPKQSPDFEALGEDGVGDGQREEELAELHGHHHPRPRTSASCGTRAFRAGNRSRNSTPMRWARSTSFSSCMTARQRGARLADGRRYLSGDRFTAADLTFAALLGPVLLLTALRSAIPFAWDELSPEFRAEVERVRATPAGQFALRLYAEERGRSAHGSNPA